MAFAACRAMIEKALTTVVSAFSINILTITFIILYDGHLRYNSLVICFTIGYKVMPNLCTIIGKKNTSFVW